MYIKEQKLMLQEDFVQCMYLCLVEGMKLLWTILIVEYQQ